MASAQHFNNLATGKSNYFIQVPNTTMSNNIVKLLVAELNAGCALKKLGI
jgi:hypothetical protein